MTTRLIEKWLPIAAIGEESVRERRSMTALPPNYYLHVWWARRPLVASRAAVIASLIPEDADKQQFLQILGIHGDPVSVRRRIDAAKRTGENLGSDIYGYPRAFSHSPSKIETEWLRNELTRAGHKQPLLIDPTAGGGSIPFEAARLGISVCANDLNPVAAIILKQTVEAPILLGLDVFAAFSRLSKEFLSRASILIKDLYVSESSRRIVDGYLWARTISCKYCDRTIPQPKLESVVRRHGRSTDP